MSSVKKNVKESTEDKFSVNEDSGSKRHSRKVREQISSLANQLYSNPLINKQQKLALIYQLETLLNKELENMNVSKSQLLRTDATEQQPIWINHKGVLYPAMLKCLNGFKKNLKDENLLEIREGDIVMIEVNETDITAKKGVSAQASQDLPFKFCGDVKKPDVKESQTSADFVVDDNEGRRYMVQISLNVDDENVEKQSYKEINHKESVHEGDNFRQSQLIHEFNQFENADIEQSKHGQNLIKS